MISELMVSHLFIVTYTGVVPAFYSLLDRLTGSNSELKLITAGYNVQGMTNFNKE